MPTLTPLSEVAESLTALDVMISTIGFLPGNALYQAPYPFPSSTSYPGGRFGLIGLTEDAQTLTPLAEV